MVHVHSTLHTDIAKSERRAKERVSSKTPFALEGGWGLIMLPLHLEDM